MRYLVFECFDHELASDERREYILDGFYAFQDYAALHWVDHLQSLLSNEQLHLEGLASATDEYTAIYGERNIEQGMDLQYSLPHQEPTPVGDFPETISLLIGETRTRRARGEGIDTFGALGHIISNVRIAIEELASTMSSDSDTKKEMETYYGRNWYKCPKHPCFYFHEGFPSARLRDGHVQKHERPFCCIENGCPWIQIGFSSEKELKKHMSITHPDPGALSWKFCRVKEKPQSRVFQCTLCPKHFTRQYGLRDHLRTHTDERPFVCTVCGKAFARQKDRMRHEILHSGEKKFVCNGVLGTGDSWGCTRRFARAEALGKHLRSGAGRVCIAPLLEEEGLAKRQRCSDQRTHDGDAASQRSSSATSNGAFAVPEALLQQYPALQTTKWEQHGQENVRGPSDALNRQETWEGAHDVSMDWTQSQDL